MNDNIDPLAKSKWNYAAIVSVFIILAVNAFAGIALLMGKISIQDWGAVTGPINGAVLGWVSKEMTS